LAYPWKVERTERDSWTHERIVWRVRRAQNVAPGMLCNWSSRISPAPSQRKNPQRKCGPVWIQSVCIDGRATDPVSHVAQQGAPLQKPVL